MKNKLLKILPYIFVAGFIGFVLSCEVAYEREHWDQCIKERSTWSCLLGAG